MADEKVKRKVGRPPKINDKVINKVKNYLIAGLTLSDACLLAEVPYTTWNDYERKHPDFRRKRKLWQGMLKAQAQANIAGKIMNEKDPEYSTWLLEHEAKLADKRADNALRRAKTKQIKTNTKIQEQQLGQVKAFGQQTLDTMSNLTTEQLIALTHISDDESGDVIDDSTQIE